MVSVVSCVAPVGMQVPFKAYRELERKRALRLRAKINLERVV